MDILLATDRALFFTVNHLPHTAVTDWLALFFSGVGTAGSIWVIIGFLLFLREEKKDHRFFVPMLIGLGTCLFLVEWLLKFLVARPRPGVLEGAIVIGSAVWFSFPSTHAATSWAMTVILSHYEPRMRWVFVVLALIISFTRVYLGVHYPSDVLAGMVLGTGIGVVALRFRKRLPSEKK